MSITYPSLKIMLISFDAGKRFGVCCGRDVFSEDGSCVKKWRWMMTWKTGPREALWPPTWTGAPNQMKGITHYSQSPTVQNMYKGGAVQVSSATLGKFIADGRGDSWRHTWDPSSFSTATTFFFVKNLSTYFASRLAFPNRKEGWRIARVHHVAFKDFLLECKGSSDFKF